MIVVISLRRIRRQWRAWAIRFVFSLALIYALSAIYDWFIRPLW